MFDYPLLARQKFLLIDDDELLLEICEERLEKVGATAVSATAFAPALELVSTFEPHFILLDLMLADGPVSVEQVLELQRRQGTTERRVILHSGVAATELYRHAQELNALGAVQKTGDDRVFLHRLHRLVELCEAIRHGATDRPSIPY